MPNEFGGRTSAVRALVVKGTPRRERCRPRCRTRARRSWWQEADDEASTLGGRARSFDTSSAHAAARGLPSRAAENARPRSGAKSGWMRLRVSMLDARPSATSDAGTMKARISSRRANVRAASARSFITAVHSMSRQRKIEYRSMTVCAPSPFEAQFRDAVCEGRVLRENGDMRQDC